jgi:hypothetical protein
MVNDWFVVHDGLMGAARFPSPTRPRQRISTAGRALRRKTAMIAKPDGTVVSFK